ncbi:MAG: recombinase family protein [Acidiferrobacterales bacterium]
MCAILSRRDFLSLGISEAPAVEFGNSSQHLSTPAGKALFQMCGVFAEFERSMIQERVKAGLARARAQGKKLGRPRVAASIERKVRTHRTKGMGIKAIARKLGIGTGTVQRIVKEAA